jgi:hypothetical protein
VKFWYAFGFTILVKMHKSFKLKFQICVVPLEIENELKLLLEGVNSPAKMNFDLFQSHDMLRLEPEVENEVPVHLQHPLHWER